LTDGGKEIIISSRGAAMELALDRIELKKIIKEAVREVIEESGWEQFQKTLKFVSDREMRDIEGLYGEPKEEETFYSEELDI
jgi:hypothetical protein